MAEAGQVESVEVVAKADDADTASPLAKVLSEPQAGDAADQAPPKRLFLSRVERLSLENLQLRRQQFELQAQQQIAAFQKEQEQLVAEINARLGEDIADFSINLKTGEATYDERAANINKQQKAMLAAQEQAAKSEPAKADN